MCYAELGNQIQADNPQGANNKQTHKQRKRKALAGCWWLGCYLGDQPAGCSSDSDWRWRKFAPEPERAPAPGPTANCQPAPAPGPRPQAQLACAISNQLTCCAAIPGHRTAHRV